MTPIVLDTNVVLDLFIYSDPRQAILDKSLQTDRLQWLATSAMRSELARVLDYPQVAKRRLVNKQSSDDVLAQMDSLATYVEAATKAPTPAKTQMIKFLSIWLVSIDACFLVKTKLCWPCAHA